MTRHVEVRPGVYRDSVTLMQVSQRLTEDPTIDHALVAMGTALNTELLTDAGYDVPRVEPSDLVIAFDTTAPSAGAVLATVDQLLEKSDRPVVGADLPDLGARTVRTAARRAGATVALISVPGEHAFREAIAAVEAGLHPIVFSDNVPIEHEIVLKQRANRAGLLAMGPDCGTVILDGVGLGFANVVSPGPVGLVSASGTGAQQVCALCDQAGVGVRHVLGLGGRDLTDEVGGLSGLPALQLLIDDSRVGVIGLVAKELGPETARTVNELLAVTDKPSVVISTADLTAGTAELVERAGSSFPDPLHRAPPADRSPGTGRLLGLYSGGTLAAEADHILTATGAAAEIIDLGDDTYTRGRPHPMIDYRLRVQRLGELSRSAGVSAVLLDVVLGHGCASDPAAEIGPAIAALELPVHVALIGTTGDPQGRDRQADALAAAGAHVHGSNSAAVRAAIEQVTP